LISSLSLIFLLCATLLGAIATLILKRGVDKTKSFRKLFKETSLLGGFFIYAISVVLYIFVLRKEELSVVYPLASMTYIWTTFFSVKYLGENMNFWKWFSLFGIILGAFLIGVGS